jgi:hypothetical protein
MEVKAQSFQVRFHPDGNLVVGDQVSLEVIAPAGADLEGRRVQVELPTQQGATTLGPNEIAPFGLGRRLQATWLWAWDTTGLQPGTYQLQVQVLPDGPQWSQAVTLLPADQAPPPEPEASWQSRETDCCEIFYVSGTEAERDIDALAALADAQALQVKAKLGIDSVEPGSASEKIPLVLIPRVLGHGGFSSKDIAVSYLDRNYAGDASAQVLHHEMVHWLDSRLGGDLRPSLFVEGLAVYLSEGHFKPEPLFERAAALLPPAAGCAGQAVCSLDRFIPLEQLAGDFYPQQHETGYLQAGALVEYMVDTWGWQAFSDFYRDIHPLEEQGGNSDEAQRQVQAIQAALQKHFDLDLQQIETQFLQALQEVELTQAMVDDVRLSAAYYDTLRRYQAVLDPSAYFLYAWLADSRAMRERGIVADYLRRPQQAENIALETMLVAADQALRAGDFGRVERLLASVNAVLAIIEQGGANPFAADSLASDFSGLVEAVQRRGYTAQQIDLGENEAWVQASSPRLEMAEMVFQRQPQGWVFAQFSSLIWPLDLWAQAASPMGRCIGS